MDYTKYDDRQLQLASIPNDFYVDAMVFINNLDGLDKLIAERVTYTLKCYLDEICCILSQTIQG